MKRISIFVAAAILSTASIAGVVNVNKAQTKLIKLIRGAFDDVVNDPYSIQMRNLKTDGSSVCGEVNAKNAYGAYVGYRKFMAIYNAQAKYARILQIDNPDEFVAQSVCADHGM